MPKELEVPWFLIQKKYQAGEGSCRELAELFGVGQPAVQQRCAREGWKKSKQQVVAMVSQKVIERQVDQRIEAIKAHEAKAFRVSDKLIDSVETSHDSMPEGLMDPAMIAGLASGLKTAVSVARLSLGAVDPGQRVDITTNGESLHAHALSVLAACKRAVDSGAVDPKTLDVKGLLAEYKAEEEAKKLQ